MDEKEVNYYSSIENQDLVKVTNLIKILQVNKDRVCSIYVL